MKTLLVVGYWSIASCFFAAPLLAEDVAVVIDDAKPGTYLLTVNGDRSVNVNPIRVVRPGNAPAPAPLPGPLPAPTAFETEVERLTKDVLSKGGTQTTGAALSSVYSLVADEVAGERIAPASGLDAIRAATDTVLARQADAASWQSWRLAIGEALTRILGPDKSKHTKDQVVAVLRQISTGLNLATGFKNDPRLLITWTPRTVAAAGAKADGILDGIDIAQLIELIKLVMELLKLFQGLK